MQRRSFIGAASATAAASAFGTFGIIGRAKRRRRSDADGVLEITAADLDERIRDAFSRLEEIERKPSSPRVFQFEARTASPVLPYLFEEAVVVLSSLAMTDHRKMNVRDGAPNYRHIWPIAEDEPQKRMADKMKEYGGRWKRNLKRAKRLRLSQDKKLAVKVLKGLRKRRFASSRIEGGELDRFLSV